MKSCSLIYNFVCLNQLYEDEFYDIEIEPVVADDEDADEDEGGANMLLLALMAWSNDIANAMWVQY